MWSGDVDLNDGKVAALQCEYHERLKFINANSQKKGHLNLLADLRKLQENLKSDITFLSSGNLVSYNYTYV